MSKKANHSGEINERELENLLEKVNILLLSALEILAIVMIYKPLRAKLVLIEH